MPDKQIFKTGCEERLVWIKTFCKRLGIGMTCSLCALAVCLVLLSLIKGNGIWFVPFPAVMRASGGKGGQEAYFIAGSLFLCYGIAGAICRTVFLAEKISLPVQCAYAFIPTVTVLLLTAFFCGKLTVTAAAIIIGVCAVLYLIIWRLRVWRWKCRVQEINLILPESQPSKHSFGRAATGRFCSTVLLWLCACVVGAMALSLLIL